jgi:hypothetical protein
METWLFFSRQWDFGIGGWGFPASTHSWPSSVECGGEGSQGFLGSTGGWLPWQAGPYLTVLETGRQLGDCT